MNSFAAVDIASVVSWLAAIRFEDWPQQSLRELRPAMVTDPDWHGFGTVAAPIVGNLMAHFPGCASFQRMLSVVMPGHRIEPHCDQQAPYWLSRVHVPITSNEQAWFITKSGPHCMLPGLAYRVDTQAEHGVVNDGETPRVHFLFDVRSV